MTRAKSIAELAVETEGLRRDLDGVAHTVFGNGNEGLKMKVARMEDVIDKWETLARTLRNAIIAAVCTLVVSSVCVVAGAAFVAIKQNAQEDIIYRALQRMESAQKHGTAPNWPPAAIDKE